MCLKKNVRDNLSAFQYCASSVSVVYESILVVSENISAGVSISVLSVSGKKILQGACDRVSLAYVSLSVVRIRCLNCMREQNKKINNVCKCISTAYDSVSVECESEKKWSQNIPLMAMSISVA